MKYCFQAQSIEIRKYLFIYFLYNVYLFYISIIQIISQNEKINEIFNN